ncbi:ABC transporter substrate-binding protein [Legionella spiritensis]|uniref:Amino acid (Glutamine) ABC transporter periplasmic amino acid binding protein n=1 Tax=Legionella spiritensis TaxID=452 RepID=A0A0W0YYF2_LEGSP|nr:ABC transporter substrate-binding protein [Legionella spiritensis]KTD61941.1 amino acid (glutamine) ABC transporter periplasmic amino acid binding protein [Legionella spiritensis]SNV30986.1 amino acid (glutamine) ABC transporter, periplasmic amino acid binding protein [Legionella spiritensis]
MKRFYFGLPVLLMVALAGCGKPENPGEIHFATSAEYPPFEYMTQGEIKGFDIDLARLIARELHKKAVFDNRQFSTVLPSLTSGQSDAAIATITITESRKKNVDFSDPYYFEGMAAVYNKHNPVKNQAQLAGKKMAAQLGSVMEYWLRKHFPGEQIIAFDNNNQAIEALLSGHVDVVLIDGSQGAVFSKKHATLSCAIVARAEEGYGIALRKGSLLTAQINQALKTIKARGDLEKLQQFWLQGV